MSTSTSNLPAIVVAVAVVAALVAFTFADRSSNGSDISKITHTADVDAMISKKKKYETNKEVYSHAGFSGSLKDYLHKSKGSSEDNTEVKEHTGYSGSGKDYFERHQAEEVAHLQSNAEHHSGYSGSLKDYMAGNYDKRTASNNNAKHKPKTSTAVSTSSSSSTDSGYTGSVDKYLKKFGG